MTEAVGAPDAAERAISRCCRARSRFSLYDFRVSGAGSAPEAAEAEAGAAEAGAAGAASSVVPGAEAAEAEAVGAAPSDGH